MTTWKVIAAALPLVVAAGALYAQQKRARLTAEDYAEIHRLYTRYSWAVDARDGKTWANLFTTDGIFEYSNGDKAVGHAALMQQPQNGLGTATATTPVHVTANVWVEPTAEGARGGAYVLTIVPGEKGKPAAVTGIAFYEDKLVKPCDGWRLKHRRVHSEGGLAPSIITGTLSN